MKNLLFAITLFFFCGACQPKQVSQKANSQLLENLTTKRVTLPNGWALTPVGTSLNLGDLPLNLIVSPSKKLLAVTNNGQSIQSLQLIDVMRKKLLDSKVIGSSWLGIKFTKDEKYLYVSAGNINQIFKYAIRNNKLFIYVF